MRQPTGLRPELQVMFEGMCRRVSGGWDRRRLPGWSSAEWADRFARREPELESALGGICWNYPDRAVVCAVTLLLDRLAGCGSGGVEAKRAIAEGFRVVADALDDGGGLG